MSDFFLVSVAGSYKTGSSAVVDLLREYRGIRVIDGEFKPFNALLAEILRDLSVGMPCNQDDLDGLAKRAACYGRSPSLMNVVVSRVLRTLEPYLPGTLSKRASLARLSSTAFFDTRSVFPDYPRITHELFSTLRELDERVRSGNRISRNPLSEALERYFSQLAESRKPGEKVVLDQLVKPRMATLAEFMPFARVIVVDRDPRDQFCDILRRSHAKPRYRGAERAEAFVLDYEERYRREDDALHVSGENVLRIHFEDLAYRFVDTKSCLERYLSLEGAHVRPGEYFDPEIALANTQLFRDHPNTGEINLIEDRLRSRLYPFPV